MKQILRFLTAAVAGMLAFLVIAVIPTVPGPAERGASGVHWPLFSVYLYARENPATVNVARALRILLVHFSTAAIVAFVVWMLLYRRARKQIRDSLVATTGQPR